MADPGAEADRPVLRRIVTAEEEVGIVVPAQVVLAGRVLDADGGGEGAGRA
jgi:hypothetical protein